MNLAQASDLLTDAQNVRYGVNSEMHMQYMQGVLKDIRNNIIPMPLCWIPF